MPDNPSAAKLPVIGDIPLVGSFVEGAIETISDVVTDWWTDGGESGTAEVKTQGTTITHGGEIPGCSVTVPVQMRQRAYVPPGYVVVEPPGGGKIGMKKEVARACKLWKPSKKPPISASDWNSLKKAKRTADKLDRVVKTANAVTGRADLRRVRTKR